MNGESPLRLAELPIACTVVMMLVTILAAQAAPTVRYTALSDAARKAGKLERYESCPTNAGSIRLAGYSLDFTIPKTARAYDVVPVRYTLSQPAGARRAAVEAVAFEDAAKAKDMALYDLAVPGDMGVKIEYLGSVCADLDDENYIALTPDGKAPVSPFPPVKRDPMVHSSTVREAPAAWFKFRITNTGNTILDPEGFGAAFAEPILRRFDKDGKEEWHARPVNNCERFLTYTYPGESHEIWVNFFSPKLGAMCRGLTEGDYRVDFRLVYRYHREYNYWVNIWSGVEFARLEVPVRVAKEAAETPVEPNFVAADVGETMPGDFDTFEEFMTAFRIHQGTEKPVAQQGVIYLQVAPWTENVVAKLILTDPKEIAVARLPIRVTGETLQVKHNPKNVMVVERDGREEPAVVVQAMPGMRTGFQLGPYPEEHMLRDIEEMKALGVNVIANTAGNWWIPEVSGRKGVELHSACYKYWYDVLVRRTGMKLMGWSLYPPSGQGWYDNAEPLLGRKVEYSLADGGYVGWHSNSVDMGDPAVPEVIAAWTRLNHSRWGDLWLKTRDGRVPIDIEDTWGWMRDDINLRYNLGPLGLARFREWVKAKYATLEATNKAWGSAYKNFDEIDPQVDQGIEGDGLSHGQVYNKKDHVFHDWSPAVNDWDLFRTELRMEIYSKALEIIRKTIPGAEMSLRTEGANLVIKGDPASDNMHWRHVYYSQRRNAMIYDTWVKSEVIRFHSDYTTLPYSEEDWRQAMREMVASGVIPVYLPQFDHMRDILLNDHYGRDYQVHYGLDKPTKGMMVHCLMAAYPWWKATYEEGGAPGIIWSDYLCDGFATETQKRELRLLRDHFSRMTRE